ncbi:MAG: glycosyltransferase family 39 protein [Fimbriimonadales bacterium]|nr:glycosyltransferase family 39 protein [Fimbriimonadales bacterium]
MKSTHRANAVVAFHDTRVILCVAFAIYTLWFIGYAPWHNEKVRLVGEGDPASYHLVAKVMMGSPSIQDEFPDSDVGLEIANRPIGYPLLLATLYTLFGEHPAVMIVLQMGLSLLGCGLVIAAARRIFGGNHTAGAIGGWLYALNPLLPEFACYILAEIPFVVLTVLLIYLLSHLHNGASSQKALWIGLAVGATVGMATLMRASMLYFGILLGVLSILNAAKLLRERVRLALMYLLGVALFILPWAIYNRLHYNTWRLTLSGEIHLLHMVVAVSGGELTRPALLNEVAQLMRQDGRDYQTDYFGRGEYYRKVIRKYSAEYFPRVIQRFFEGMWNFWWGRGAILTTPEWFRNSLLSKLWLRYHMVYLLFLCLGLLGWKSFGAQRIWLYYFLAAALYFTLTAGWGGYWRYRLQVFAFSIPVVVAGAIWFGQIVQCAIQSRNR